MTPDQQTELRAQAHSNPACAEALAARDLDELARILSIGRTRPSALEIGNGTILEALGVQVGNKLLDHIAANPDMRHVRPLLEQGRLKIGAPVVQAALQSFVQLGDVLSQADADKLCALGRAPAPVSSEEAAAAIYNPDGTQK